MESCMKPAMDDNTFSDTHASYIYVRYLQFHCVHHQDTGTCRERVGINDLPALSCDDHLIPDPVLHA